MHKVIRILKNDLQNAWRDPVFRVLMLFPFLAFFLIRFLLPWLLTRFPSLAAYQDIIVMWACLQAGTMFGFLYGFLLLEEKETAVFDYLRIMPLKAGTLMGSRLWPGLLVSWIVNFCILAYGGVLFFPLWQNLLIGLQYSFIAPVLTLALAAFAQNRMQGLAHVKVYNLLFILPALIYFFEAWWPHLGAFIPSYFSFQSIAFAHQAADFWKWWSLGSLYYTGLLYALLFLFSRRVMQA